jgi:hypothetical protein
MRALRTLLLALALPSGALGATVTALQLDADASRPEALRSLLETREGAEFSPAVWEADVRRLRETELFYSVQAASRAAPGGVELALKVRNKFSKLPVFKFKRGGGVSLVTAGAYDANLGGRLLEAGGQFESFDGRPGFAVWFRHPYFASPRNKLGTEVLRHTTALPLYSTDAREEAAFEDIETRWNGRVVRGLGAGFEAGLEGSVATNRFLRDDSSARRKALNDAFLAATPLDSGRTVSVAPSVRVGRLVKERHRVSGWEAEARVELAHRSFGSQFDFLKGTVSGLWGLSASPRWDLAGQARLGTKTGRAFQHKFYLGGLDTTRGFLDRQFRGEHMWMVNAEARPTLLERETWVVQGALFMDLGKTWDARAFGSEGFHDPIFSQGAGLRLILPKVYRAVLRVDAARTQRPVGQMGVSVGLQQFF